MTNFSELKQNNPLSFKLFEQWVERNYETTLNIWNGTIRNEDVVEFLDENKTYVNTSSNNEFTSVAIAQYENEELTSNVYWGLYSSRNMAVELAIKKAFELLENKLKQN